MPASSEIRFKIGADTSALSSAFVKAQSIAATASSSIAKRFSLKDAFRGLAQGLGIGSVDAIADAVVRPFQLAYERAKELETLTGSLAEIQNKEIVSTGGRRAVVDAMKREVNHIAAQIKQQEQAVENLDTGAALVNPIAANFRRAEEQELVNLKVRHAELQSQIAIEVKNTNKATQAWAREQSLLQDLGEAELRNASDREKLQMRLNALVSEYNRIIKAGNAGTDLERQNMARQFDLHRQMALLDKKSREERARERVSLGSALAGSQPGRLPSPRARGRSERERIADRGLMFQNQAEEAIRTGRSPDFVASLTSKANRDLGAAGDKAAAAAAKVANQDNAISSQLVAANLTLLSIDRNLKPRRVGSESQISKT